MLRLKSVMVFFVHVTKKTTYPHDTFEVANMEPSGASPTTLIGTKKVTEESSYICHPKDPMEAPGANSGHTKSLEKRITVVSIAPTLGRRSQAEGENPFEIFQRQTGGSP